MLSGRRLDLLDPSPFDVEIEDIAHGLARVARWNGQTKGAHAFSVAEHSVLVEDIVVQLRPDIPTKWRLAALLHDAPEYVVGDLISPFKAAIGLDYKALELRLLAAIHIRFALPPDLPKSIAAIIKRSDRLAAYFEAVYLAGFDETEAQRFFGRPRGLSEAFQGKLTELNPLPVKAAQLQFLERFKTLVSDGEACD